MRFEQYFLFLLFTAVSEAFVVPHGTTASLRTTSATSLGVSIGLGPDQEEKTQQEKLAELVEGVDYEVPDHELYRTSRRSKLDEECDAWYGTLLEGSDGFLSDIAKGMRELLSTPVELKNEVALPVDHPDYTPYVNTKLPWTPLVPAFGLEEYGLPIPRRSAETWRQFDVAGMVRTDYSTDPEGVGTDLELDDEEVERYRAALKVKGGWLDDEQVDARLVYVNGRFCPALSKTSDSARNMNAADLEDPLVGKCLGRLTDGFTDEMAAPIPNGPSEFLTSFRNLSKPDHNMGDPTSQFAINAQQGTACFAALNSIKTGAIAYVRQQTEASGKPVLIVNAVTKDGGASPSREDGKGVAFHPRALIIAEDDTELSFVQSMVDLDEGEDCQTLYNGYTQIFVGANANVTHSYLEETGGVVTAETELRDSEIPEGAPKPREIEAKRPALKNTHLEIIDTHVVGDDGNYNSTVLSVGGSGRVRIAQSVALLRPRANAELKGFSLCGGAQRIDMKTNIHHCGQGTTSKQLQKTMVGGRAQGAFRGRIRVEQSAQQTDSNQLSRTILLTDKCRAYAIPSLEIIADDVQCAHGATVADLSDEELFYLRSRGLGRELARKLLMYGFAGDITNRVDPLMRGLVDGNEGIQSRVVAKLKNLVPQGERAIRGEFQSV